MRGLVDNIRRLIEKYLQRMNTVSLGIVTSVHLDRQTVDLRLKYSVAGQEIPLFEVPYLYPSYRGSTIAIAPGEGDVVVVIFTKRDLEALLRDRSIVSVSEESLFDLNNAIVLCGVLTKDDPPPDVKDGEILISHKSGSYIRFKDNGDIDVKTDKFEVI